MYPEGFQGSYRDGKSIYQYLVFDVRFHTQGMNLDISFASDDLDEAKQVASEYGTGFVVVEYNPETEAHRLVFDGSVPRDLGLK